MKLKRTKKFTDIIRLHEKLFPVDDVCEIDGTINWLLMDNKKAVGFCMLKPLDDEIAFLHESGVLTGYSGKGLQRRMIRCRERYARKNGFSKIITYTKIHNVRSSVNLSRCGYQLYMPENQYADDDCIYWIKHL